MNYRINNTYFPYKEQHKYTFYNNRNKKSIIDYIITNQVLLPQQILDIRVLTSININTDHQLVLEKIRINKIIPIAKTDKFHIEWFTNECPL